MSFPGGPRSFRIAAWSLLFEKEADHLLSLSSFLKPPHLLHSTFTLRSEPLIASSSSPSTSLTISEQEPPLTYLPPSLISFTRLLLLSPLQWRKVERKGRLPKPDPTVLLKELPDPKSPVAAQEVIKHVEDVLGVMDRAIRIRKKELLFQDEEGVMNDLKWLEGYTSSAAGEVTDEQKGTEETKEALLNQYHATIVRVGEARVLAMSEGVLDDLKKDWMGKIREEKQKMTQMKRQGDKMGRDDEKRAGGKKSRR